MFQIQISQALPRVTLADEKVILQDPQYQKKILRKLELLRQDLQSRALNLRQPQLDLVNKHKMKTRG